MIFRIEKPVVNRFIVSLVSIDLHPVNSDILLWLRVFLRFSHKISGHIQPLFERNH